MEKKGTLRQKRRPKGDPNPQKGPLGDPGTLKGTQLGTVLLDTIKQVKLLAALVHHSDQKEQEATSHQFRWLSLHLHSHDGEVGPEVD